MNIELERWKAHPLFFGKLELSDQGRVRRPERQTAKGTLPEKILRQRQHHKNRYWIVQFEIDGKNYTRTVHRLVLETFVGSCPSDEHEAMHGPAGDRRSNVLSNLSWGLRTVNRKEKRTWWAAVRDPLCQ